MQWRNPRIIATALFVSLSSLIGTCSAEAVFATGHSAGTYFAVGSALAAILNRDSPGRINVVETDGSISNMRRLASHEANLAIVQSDILSKTLSAREGDPLHELKAAARGFRGIASLFPEYTQTLVKADGPINRIEQLAGRKLYIGRQGSGSRNTAKDVLAALGINSHDAVDNDVGSEAALRLPLDDELDAVFLTSGELKNEQPGYPYRLRMISIPTHFEQIIR